MVKTQTKRHLQSQPILSDFVCCPTLTDLSHNFARAIWQRILLDFYKFARLYCTIMLEQFDEKFHRIFAGFGSTSLTDLLDIFAVFHWTILLEQFDEKFRRNFAGFFSTSLTDLLDIFAVFHWTIMLEQFDKKFRRIFAGFCSTSLTDLLDIFAVFHWTIMLEQFDEKFRTVLPNFVLKVWQIYWTILPDFIGQFCWSNLWRISYGFAGFCSSTLTDFIGKICQIILDNFAGAIWQRNLQDFAGFCLAS